MPVPATRGQLRTRIEDMQIGDYIVCNYQASNRAVGTFSNFGGTAGTEIPVEGSATPNGTFYFIKVDKGLLVADRVVQHSISWDALNSGRLIQGKSHLLLSSSIDAVPAMFSNNAPIGVVRSDSIWTSSTDAWNAFSDFVVFNGQYTESGWMSGKSTTSILTDDRCWISYEFPVPKEIRGITLIQLGWNSVGYRCKDFSVQCSQDGQTWQTVFSGIALPNYNKQLFVFEPIGAYKYWRFVIYSHCQPGQSWALGISQLEFLEEIPAQLPKDTYIVFRTITGGVSYADVNGNRSTTDQGYGGWPTNNEFDKYILNFRQDLIQEGHTVFDVFHHDVIKTWTWDTPIINIGGNTTRVCRGGTTGTNNFSVLASSTVDATVGFRPVLEYKEV